MSRYKIVPSENGVQLPRDYFENLSEQIKFDPDVEKAAREGEHEESFIGFMNGFHKGLEFGIYEGFIAAHLTMKSMLKLSEEEQHKIIKQINKQIKEYQDREEEDEIFPY